MTLADAPSAATNPAQGQVRDRPSFRPDIDGLRAVAILPVVGYHVGLPFLGGGFIGVDMFFVISGFLITRNMIDEADRSDRIGLIAFWGRQIRRLVPAMALLLIVTLVASLAILPTFAMRDVAEQAVAAALYLSNVLFAREAGDYFTTDLESSPLLHTWSLGVEEQFYVIWPLAVGIVVALARRFWSTPAARRVALGVLFATVAVGSMVVNLQLTSAASPWAFFGLQARAWQFAAAGLLAVLVIPARARGAGVRTAMAVVGVILVVVALAVIDDSSSYPGTLALLPVIATLLLVMAGDTSAGRERPTPIHRGLSWGPAQGLGRVSYSWYLWHWPAIVLTVAAADDDSVQLKSAAALGSLLVGWLAYRYFENPIRLLPSLVRSRRATFGLGAALTSVVVVCALALQPSADLPPLDALDPESLQAPSTASLEERVDYKLAVYAARGDDRCPGTPGSVEAPLGSYCILGNPDGAATVVLLGDSHAGTWRTLMGAVAEARDLRLVVRQHNGCPAFPVELAWDRDDKDERCAQVQRGNELLLDQFEPDAVILAAWGGFGETVEGPGGEIASLEDQARLWGTGAEAFYRGIRSRGIPLGILLDQPTLPENPNSCLRRADSVAECEAPVDGTLARHLIRAEQDAIERVGEIDVLETWPVVCPEDTCLLEVDGIFTYVDRHHLTDAFTVYLRPDVEAMLDRLLG